MLLAAVEHVQEAGGDPRTFFGKLFAQEKNLTTSSVARMNLLLHGVEDFHIERGDTLRSPVFTDPSTGGLATFDVVIANPPFGLKNWGREVWESDPWGRPSLGLPNEQAGDFAWLQHMMHSMAPRSGRMAVVMPQSVLFKAGSEGQMRKKLLRTGAVDAVVGLPLNIFYGTGLPACLVVLRHPRTETPNKSDVLVIDASQMFEPGRAQNYLQPCHVQAILDLYRARKDVKHRSSVVGFDKIRENSWTLNVTRYVVPPVDGDVLPASEAMTNLKRCLTRVRASEDELTKALSCWGGPG